MSSDIPDDVHAALKDLIEQEWKVEKRKFLRVLGDRNHRFRKLARLNDYFELGLRTGKPAREMLDHGPFDDRGEMENPFPEEAEGPME